MLKSKIKFQTIIENEMPVGNWRQTRIPLLGVLKITYLAVMSANILSYSFFLHCCNVDIEMVQYFPMLERTPHFLCTFKGTEWKETTIYRFWSHCKEFLGALIFQKSKMVSSQSWNVIYHIHSKVFQQCRRKLMQKIDIFLKLFKMLVFVES